MPVTAVSNGYTSGDQTALAFSHASDGNPLYLLLSWYVGSGTLDTVDRVTGVTFDGVPLARGGIQHVAGQTMQWWVLFAPPTTTADVVISLSSARRVSAAALNLTGWPTTIEEHTFAARGQYGVTEEPSVTVVTQSGSEVLDWLGFNNGAQTTSAGAGQTEKWSQDGLGGGFGADHDQLSAGSLASATGASRTMSWTLSQVDDFWGLGAISYPNPGSGTSTPFTDGDPGTLAMIALTDRADVVHPFSDVDLNDAVDYESGYKAPRVLSFQTIRTALSDAQGRVEHVSFGATLSDIPRDLRGLLDDAVTKYLAGAPLVVKTIADAARRLEQDWHHEMAGAVTAFKPTPDLQCQIVGSDWLKKRFGRNRSFAEFWVPLLTRADFPLLPAELVNKAAPFWYGKVTDEIEGAPTIPADLYPRGTADPGWLDWGWNGWVPGSLSPGNYYIYATTIKDGVESKNYAFEVGLTLNPGTGGIYYRFLTAITPDKFRLYISDAPEFEPFTNPLAGTFARYIDIVPDVDAPTDVNPYGGPTGSRYFLVDSLSLGADYHALVDDGSSGALVTPKGAVRTKYVGDLTIGGVTRSAFLVGRGAIKTISGVFLNGVLQTSTGSGTEIECPFLDDYATTFGANYIDLNGTRYTIVFATGQTALNAINGSAPIDVNLNGIESIGDTTGVLLTSPVQFNKHFERNFLAANFIAGSAPATTWLTASPVLPNGAPTQDDASYDEAAAQLAQRLVGGYECAGGICTNYEPEGALDVLASLHLNGDFDGGINRAGQSRVSVEPFAAPDPGDVIVLTDVREINDRSFGVDIDQAENFWNVWQFRHTQDYTGRTSEGWYMRGTSRDADSITNNDIEQPAPSTDLRWLRNNTAQATATILEVVKRRRIRFRNPRNTATFEAPYLSCAAAVLGTVLRLDHIEGLSASGWVGHDVRVIAIETDLDRMVRRFVAYDLQPIYDGLEDAVDPVQEALGEQADPIANLQQSVIQALTNESGITELTGDVTAGPGAGVQTATIAAAAVTNAKLANMAQSRVKGRAAGAGTGAPTDLDPDAISTILDGAGDPFLRTSVGGGPAGGAWTLAASWAWSTNVASVAFTGLGIYSALMVIARNISCSGSGFRVLHVSVNNGSTYYTASGDYVQYDENGQETNQGNLGGNSQATTAARSFSLLINGSNVNGAPKLSFNSGLTASNRRRMFVGSTNPIDAIRVSDTSGGNLTGGTIHVLGM